MELNRKIKASRCKKGNYWERDINEKGLKNSTYGKIRISNKKSNLIKKIYRDEGSTYLIDKEEKNKKKSFGYVYKATNELSGKNYIGQTISSRWGTD